jgi:inward rectifier potassium channel
MFSRVALVTPYDGMPTLMFRAANQRRNRILEAQASVTLVRNEWTAEGTVMRRFYDLALKRQRNTTFILTWTVMHAVDTASPLSGATPETLRAQEAEIIVTLQGLDEGLLQTIHARQNYRADDILWNRRFVDIIGRTQEGRLTVDYDHFHDVEKIDT